MLPVKQPPNGTGPRHLRGNDAGRWHRCYVVSLTVFASATLATLVTFGILNFLLNDVSLPPISTQTAMPQGMQPDAALSTAGGLMKQQPVPGDARVLDGAGLAGNSSSDAAPEEPKPPALKQPAPRAFKHPFDDLQHLYTLPPRDTSKRCQQSQICDGDHSCGPDGRGCITSSKERQDHVRKAIAWAWEGYRWVSGEGAGWCRWCWTHNAVGCGDC